MKLLKNLKINKNSLTIKVWLYLIVFSVIILAFLWFFQIVFLDTYYEYVKTKSINTVASNIRKNYTNNNYKELLNNIAYNDEICVEVIENGMQIFSSNSFNRGCIIGLDYNNGMNDYKQEFILSGKDSQSYKIINPKFNNNTLVKAIKLGSTYIFLNASLEPISEATGILQSQLIFVTFIVLLLSFVIAYFISKRISNPIIKINKQATRMSKGDYAVVFDTETDIAEINELSVTLKDTCSELSKTDELRRDLMANVSHDLKTPLTMIKAYAEMVRDITYKNKEKRNNNLNTIIKETDRLNILVNDILELSKMQSNINIMNYTDFDLIEVIKNILNNYSIIEINENYKLILDTSITSVIVNADQKRIEQVIYNLINNAINYVGDDKKVIIKVTEIDDKIKVEVIDHGKGIDEKDIKFIWDKYYKTNKNHKRNVIGTGLGLSIVKNILIEHKSNYGVNSIKGKGTTFYFDIKKK